MIKVTESRVNLVFFSGLTNRYFFYILISWRSVTTDVNGELKIIDIIFTYRNKYRYRALFILDDMVW
jgi:hypothetical protein